MSGAVKTLLPRTLGARHECVPGELVYYLASDSLLVSRQYRNIVSCMRDKIVMDNALVPVFDELLYPVEELLARAEVTADAPDVRLKDGKRCFHRSLLKKCS